MADPREQCGQLQGLQEDKGPLAGGLAEVNRLDWTSWKDAPGQLNVTIMVADAPAHNTPQSGAKYHNFNQSKAFAKHVDVWTNPKRNTEQAGSAGGVRGRV